MNSYIGNTAYLIKRVVVTEVEPVGTPGLLWVHTDPVSRVTVFFLYEDGQWHNVLQGGGKSGSTVEWNQLVTSGTKIGTITIDNVDTDIYVPASTSITVVDNVISTSPTDALSANQGRFLNNKINNLVQVNPLISTGSKIAVLTINGTAYDLYAPTSSGSSSVEVTQILTTGVGIATITVDGVPTTLYAPAGGSGYPLADNLDVRTAGIAALDARQGYTLKTMVDDNKVTFTRLLNSGTPIGSITTGGTTTVIYAPNGGSGGGSTVEVTPIYTSGTKIATITVDDNDIDLYIPEYLPATYNQNDDSYEISKDIVFEEDVEIDGSLNVSDISSLSTLDVQADTITLLGTIQTDDFTIRHSSQGPLINTGGGKISVMHPGEIEVEGEGDISIATSSDGIDFNTVTISPDKTTITKPLDVETISHNGEILISAYGGDSQVRIEGGLTISGGITATSMEADTFYEGGVTISSKYENKLVAVAGGGISLDRITNPGQTLISTTGYSPTPTTGYLPASLSGNTYNVSNLVAFNAETYFGDDLNIGNNALISWGNGLTMGLNNEGALEISNGELVSGRLTSSALTVNGTTTLNGETSLESDLAVNGTTTLNGETSLGANLNVASNDIVWEYEESPISIGINGNSELTITGGGINSEGGIKAPFFSEDGTELSSKYQAILTAGTGISIVNNVISATGEIEGCLPATYDPVVGYLVSGHTQFGNGLYVDGILAAEIIESVNSLTINAPSVEISQNLSVDSISSTSGIDVSADGTISLTGDEVHINSPLMMGLNNISFGANGESQIGDYGTEVVLSSSKDIEINTATDNNIILGGDTIINGNLSLGVGDALQFPNGAEINGNNNGELYIYADADINITADSDHTVTVSSDINLGANKLIMGEGADFAEISAITNTSGTTLNINGLPLSIDDNINASSFSVGGTDLRDKVREWTAKHTRIVPSSSFYSISNKAALESAVNTEFRENRDSEIVFKWTTSGEATTIVFNAGNIPVGAVKTLTVFATAASTTADLYNLIGVSDVFYNTEDTEYTKLKPGSVLKITIERFDADTILVTKKTYRDIA